MRAEYAPFGTLVSLAKEMQTSSHIAPTWQKDSISGRGWDRCVCLWTASHNQNFPAEGIYHKAKEAQVQGPPIHKAWDKLSNMFTSRLS